MPKPTSNNSFMGTSASKEKIDSVFPPSDAKDEIKIEKPTFEGLGRDREIPRADRLGGSTLAAI
jgi:hypothetical protein